ncbi:DEAD-box-family helicase, putative [Theileria annulata]|uniref:ATP-dependent RNA helicase n=1 Tax=Theileria annulata TaxID=5874 RepID=Q4U8W5_THEAN|nr:DEAD-box-family helicase, putative [Theileria annulata]CAI76738.1 DEAD-box-family helicase, putative [Theileria annulata]|eukprot:XP_953363.1 DEAD-box-family helicase, putative [Theileria annulata]
MNCSFSNLDLDESLVSSLANFGITEPSPIQFSLIKSSTDENSIIFQSKSGTGKTVSLCIVVLNKIIKRRILGNEYSDLYHEDLSHFSKPPSILFGEVLFIVPTSELAYQIYLFFSSIKQYLECVNAIILASDSKLLELINQLKTNEFNVVISTPGKFITILKKKPKDNEVAEFGIKSNGMLLKTNLLIFDEADLLLDDHFLEQTRYICNKVVNPFVQVVAVSATFMKPQFKSFEDIINKADSEYIDKLTKMKGEDDNAIKVEDLLNLEPRLLYYLNHLLISKRITKASDIFEYLSTYERKLTKIILSTSYLSRYMDPKTAGSNKESYYLTSETTESVDEVIDLNPPSLVLEKIKFYMGSVPDAPNIVMQIGLKVEVVAKVLFNVDYRKCIIFCNQTHTRVQTCKLLQSLGFKCYINSSRLSHGDRMKMFEYISIDKVIILCTDIMSRGIGFPNVDLVINMDMPSSKEVFLHRSGRSGRFGAQGICVSVCMESEVETYRYFMYSLNFKSFPVEELQNGGYQDSISTIFKNSITFTTLFQPESDLSKMIKPSLATSMMDLEQFKFKVSIIGLVSANSVRIFNPSGSQTFMYFELNGSEMSVYIRSLGDGSTSYETIFHSDGPKVLVYLDRVFYKSPEFYRNKSEVTHIMLEINNISLLLTLFTFELEKLITCASIFLEFVPLELESQCNIDCGDIKSVFDKNINAAWNVGSEEELSLVFSTLRLEPRPIGAETVKYFIQKMDFSPDFNALIYLYTIYSEKIQPGREFLTKVMEVNPYTISRYFLSRHVSHWKSLEI